MLPCAAPCRCARHGGPVGRTRAHLCRWSWHPHCHPLLSSHRMHAAFLGDSGCVETAHYLALKHFTSAKSVNCAPYSIREAADMLSRAPPAGLLWSLWSLQGWGRRSTGSCTATEALFASRAENCDLLRRVFLQTSLGSRSLAVTAAPMMLPWPSPGALQSIPAVAGFKTHRLIFQCQACSGI